MLAALSEQFDLLRRLMADPDPKVALRASAEMSKLMGICARNDLSPKPGAEVIEVVPPQPPAAPPPVPYQPPATESLLADVLAMTKPVSTLQPISTDRRPSPDTRHRPFSPTGQQLTSFLGKPAPAQKPPDRGKSV
jgi:hypothetical protein